jgi:hypothetical protein
MRIATRNREEKTHLPSTHARAGLEELMNTRDEEEKEVQDGGGGGGGGGDRKSGSIFDSIPSTRDGCLHPSQYFSQWLA